jgi:hypothetical protein
VNAKGVSLDMPVDHDAAPAVADMPLRDWLGIKGNEMTAKNLLENGWEFADSGSDAVRFARLKWGLAIPQEDLDRTKSLVQPVDR